jgi:hypothetical protein
MPESLNRHASLIDLIYIENNKKTVMIEYLGL